MTIRYVIRVRFCLSFGRVKIKTFLNEEDVHDRKRGDNQFSKRRFNLRTLHEPLLLKKDHKIQG